MKEPHPDPTPVQALHGALERHGYVQSKAATARLIGVREPNIWAYLLDGSDPRQVRPRPETLHEWCSRLLAQTWIQITIVLPPGGTLCLHVQGRDRAGRAIIPHLLPTDQQIRRQGKH